MMTETPHPSQRPHLAAVIEDRFYEAAGWLLRRVGWRPRMETYSGYGSPRRVRVLARVLLAPPGRVAADNAYRAGRRGFRHYLTVPAPHRRVLVQVGGAQQVVHSDRAGYVDVQVDVPEDPPLPPGWQRARLSDAGAPTAAERAAEPVRAPTPEDSADAPLLIIDADTRFGVISDIDDTTMVTSVPRPLLAAWNTFVRHSSKRRAVPGMPELYRRLGKAHPESPFVYLSTGAWNTAATLRAFLARNAYPPGPLLLTDWGPTMTGWFRSGQAHKDASLELLMSWFPHVRWLLVGDDGQHDSGIYARAVERRPDQVAAVAIRRLRPAEQVLAGNPPDGGATAGPEGSHLEGAGGRAAVPTVSGVDGHELAERLAEVPGVLGVPGS
ncbi:phosphatidate phosphatase APP1 [Isoptericola sp. CG 20/1183]|uniref:Phosphatidate phosphatase APP1 n=1 Tax=Isoptericola halotolerans TaxID=300560 RepID=A0ABX5EGT6_9MICO|nr:MULTISPECIES: phosphatase domain-containing protein [Isoptericola]PRZ08704.1 phosphatidate phosphatase APP1 [Isoptericola halotolerans]PRZ10849.1 phosphatidate phosphatase APP1 [Isoptericola sp. CG 20/1183]